MLVKLFCKEDFSASCHAACFAVTQYRKRKLYGLRLVGRRREGERVNRGEGFKSTTTIPIVLDTVKKVFFAVLMC